MPPHRNLCLRSILMKALITVMALLMTLTASTATAENSANPFELNNATSQELVERCFYPQELADKVIELRDSLGGFQSWDDLDELNIDKGMLDILKAEATIAGISVDCGC